MDWGSLNSLAALVVVAWGLSVGTRLQVPKSKATKFERAAFWGSLSALLVGGILFLFNPSQLEGPIRTLVVAGIFFLVATFGSAIVVQIIVGRKK